MVLIAQFNSISRVMILASLCIIGCSQPGDKDISLAQTRSELTTCVTIQRGTSGDIFDTQIARNRPSKNYGHMPVANAGTSGGGERQALLRADLGAIPPDVTIESATLTLWQNNTGSAVVNVHQVLALWAEDTVTWRSFDGAFAAEVSASASNGGPTHEGPIAFDLTALVQAWVSGASPNHGVLLKQEPGATTRLLTGKVGNLTRRPRLEVCYTPAIQPEGTSLFVQVRDETGAPIPSAAVTVAGTLHATDGVGRILLENLMPGRFVARVEARGYASASVVIDLPSGAHMGTEVRLWPLGPPIPFEAKNGAVLEQGPVRVQIPAGALVDYKGEPVTGTVEATVVPLDPSVAGLADLPGPLEAVREDGEARVELESLIMAEVSLWQDGLPVQLAPGAKARLELRLPDAFASEYTAGDIIPAWWFDLDAGLWREEGAGTIQPASDDPGKLAWVVEVGHFTWWNCDRPWTEKNCFAVTVVDTSGTPVPGMTVGATGVSYSGTSSISATTNEGNACVEIKLGGTVSIFVGSSSAPLASSTVTGSGPASDCAGNGAACTPVTVMLPMGAEICTPGTSVPCSYSGPPGTEGVGICRAATKMCNATGTAWSGCVGEVLPEPETCTTPFDDDCDGQANEPDADNCECGTGDTTQCYSGPPDTLGVGICAPGVRTCDPGIGRYGPCLGEVLPEPETCATPEDDNCDGSTDCSGTLLWSRIYEPTSGLIMPYAVLADGGGNVLMAGRLWGTVDFGGGPIGTPFSTPMTPDNRFMAKLDAEGQHVWSRQLGQGSWGHSYLNTHIAVDASGNILIAGKFSGMEDFGGDPITSAGLTDIFVAKIDGSGQHVWTRRFGGPGADYAGSLAVDSTGNILLAGRAYGPIDLGGGPIGAPSQNNYFVAKLNASGQHVWSRSPITDSGHAFPRTLAVDSTNSVLVTGGFAGTVDFGGGPISSWSGSSFVLKLDANGQHVWSRALGIEGSPASHSIVVGAADNIVIRGDSSGMVDFGGGPTDRCSGCEFLFIVKLDASGQYVWSYVIEKDPEEINVDSLSVDPAGNVLVTGGFPGIVDFGGGPLHNPEWGAYVLKLDTSGQHVWSRVFSSDDESVGRSIAADDSGNVLLTGAASGTVDFGSGAISMEGSGVFLIKLAP